MVIQILGVLGNFIKQLFLVVPLGFPRVHGGGFFGGGFSRFCLGSLVLFICFICFFRFIWFAVGGFVRLGALGLGVTGVFFSGGFIRILRRGTGRTGKQQQAAEQGKEHSSAGKMEAHVTTP